VDSLSKRKKLKATKKAEKRGAYPKSGARCVGRFRRLNDFHDEAFFISSFGFILLAKTKMIAIAKT
jgi:hypothetical protein